jgi:hypothetical protein
MNSGISGNTKTARFAFEDLHPSKKDSSLRWKIATLLARHVELPPLLTNNRQRKEDPETKPSCDGY